MFWGAALVLPSVDCMAAALYYRAGEQQLSEISFWVFNCEDNTHSQCCLVTEWKLTHSWNMTVPPIHLSSLLSAEIECRGSNDT